jgi:hypothetical protein
MNRSLALLAVTGLISLVLTLALLEPACLAAKPVGQLTRNCIWLPH